MPSREFFPPPTPRRTMPLVKRVVKSFPPENFSPTLAGAFFLPPSVVPFTFPFSFALHFDHYAPFRDPFPEYFYSCLEMTAPPTTFRLFYDFFGELGKFSAFFPLKIRLSNPRFLSRIGLFSCIYPSPCFSFPLFSPFLNSPVFRSKKALPFFLQEPPFCMCARSSRQGFMEIPSCFA